MKVSVIDLSRVCEGEFICTRDYLFRREDGEEPERVLVSFPDFNLSHGDPLINLRPITIVYTRISNDPEPIMLFRAAVPYVLEDKGYDVEARILAVRRDEIEFYHTETIACIEMLRTGAQQTKLRFSPRLNMEKVIGALEKLLV